MFSSVQPSKIVLTIAGFDPTGGAGVITDIKTIHALGGYGLAIITANTVQTTKGVIDVQAVASDFFECQLKSLLADLRFDAIKIGMIPNRQIQNIIVKYLQPIECPIILDTPMVSSCGTNLQQDNMHKEYEELVSKVSLITPNIAEANLLLGNKNKNLTGEQCARSLVKQFRVACLVTDGDATNDNLQDTFCADDGKTVQIFSHKKLNTKNSHGTGCTLSSAVATLLANQGELTTTLLIKTIDQAISFTQSAIFNSKNWSLAKLATSKAKTGLNQLGAITEKNSYLQ